MEVRNENSGTVKQLNSFLRGELSAVETYRRAMKKLTGFSMLGTLEQCSRSHLGRADILAGEIRRRGGTPSKESGPWGAFAKLLEDGAALFGEKAIIAVLKEGEDHGRDDYRRDLPDLDPEARQVVRSQILPEQLRTHRAMSELQKLH